MLGPEASSGYFTIGSTITLNDADGSALFLNLDTSGGASYQALTLGATATTTDALHKDKWVAVKNGGPPSEPAAPAAPA